MVLRREWWNAGVSSRGCCCTNVCQFVQWHLSLTAQFHHLREMRYGWPKKKSGTLAKISKPTYMHWIWTAWSSSRCSIFLTPLEVNRAAAVFFGSRRKNSALVQMRNLILAEVSSYQRPSMDLSSLGVYQIPWKTPQISQYIKVRRVFLGMKICST